MSGKSRPRGDTHGTTPAIFHAVHRLILFAQAMELYQYYAHSAASLAIRRLGGNMQDTHYGPKHTLANTPHAARIDARQTSRECTSPENSLQPT